MWQSWREIETSLENAVDPDRLERLFALSVFWQQAVYPANYQANAAWSKALTPSDSAKDTIEMLGPLKAEFPEPDFMLALFGKFFHHQILLDWQACDQEQIARLLEAELLGQRIRLPHRFGRLLYDRFNDLHQSTRTDHLLAEDVQKLLEGTSQGVYQVGYLVTGPLGLLVAEEPRHLPPSLEIPLWHCSDSGCGALHSVGLMPPQIPLVRAYRAISELLMSIQGPPSEWGPALASLHRGKKWPHGRMYYDCPAVIADCIIGSERTKLLRAALASAHGEKIRTALAQPPRHARDAQGSVEALADTVPTDSQLQLLMLLPDNTLVELIDDIVHRRVLRIALGEIRKPRNPPPRRGRDIPSDLGPLGIRAAEGNPLATLTSSIYRAYDSAGSLSELDWRLRSQSGRSLQDSLLTHLRAHGPAEAVASLILPSRDVTKRICDEFQITLQHAVPGDQRAIDLILWKTGFNPPRFDGSLSLLRDRLREFNEILLRATPLETEEARARVRSTGVNLFVSVEEFVDSLVTYNVWTLASDHFLGTKHSFELARARRTVAKVLGPVLRSDQLSYCWSEAGENTLGVLLRYLQESFSWMRSLEELDRDREKRPVSDLPHYADDPKYTFPYRHRALWADSDPAQLRRYRDEYGAVVKLLGQADLTEIRNGLDHFREGRRFPDGNKMLASVARIQQAVDIADMNRYYPKVFWLFSRRGDRFGAVEYEFKDYAGRSLVGYGPDLLWGTLPVSFDNPVVLAAGRLLGSENSFLAFRIRESSEYTEYWKGYPRRRRIPPNGDLVAASTDE